ncbi:hypothetical protein ACNKHR_10675 [Shigella flexneri]
MPKKIETEISFCACFQTHLCRSIFSCCASISGESRNTPAEHLEQLLL